MVTSLDMPRLNDTGRSQYPIDAAQRALLHLLDLTQPKLHTQQRALFNQRVGALSKAEGDRYATWPTATWVIDDSHVTARIFHWAGAWTGFTMVGDVAVIVAGVRIVPDDLRLQAHTDARRYHFDLREPLVYPESILRSQDDAQIRLDEEWIEWPRHPDHAALLIGT